ncbi:MAG: 4Fe-4S binding protein [Nitrososphaerota archaeon]
MMHRDAEIAILICRCMRNIKSVNFEKLEDYIKDSISIPTVYFFNELCREPATIREKLKKGNFKGVLLAGCSLYKETFADIVESAGLNPLSLELIPSRELFKNLPREYSSHTTLKLGLMICSIFEKMMHMRLIEEVKPRRIKAQSKITRRSLLKALPQILTVYQPTPVILREKCVGTSACSFCIDSCPRRILKSAEDGGLNLDYDYCSICGVCVAICPTGAIQIPKSTDKQLEAQIRTILTNHREEMRSKAIMYVDSNDYHYLLSRFVEEGLSLPLEVFPIELPTLGLISENILLVPILYGAAGTIIPVLRNENKLEYLHILYQKTNMVRNILKSAGINQEKIILIEFGENDLGFFLEKLYEFKSSVKSEQLEKSIDKHFGAYNRRAEFIDIVKSLLDDRRPLVEFIECGEPCPFGEVMIDQEKCVICELCYNKCPMKAFTITREPDTIRLGFVYQRCIGCNLCRQICTENAIMVKKYISIPRLLDDSSKTLITEELIKCLRCGKPFITKGKLRKIEKLYESVGASNVDRLESLKLCPDCKRTKLIPAEYDKWFIYR